MNLLYSLPSDIKQIIYEYDPTYNEKFNKIINLLPEMVSNFRLKNVEINKRGWSTVNAICKLRDPKVYKSLFNREHIYLRSNDMSYVKYVEKKLNDFYGGDYTVDESLKGWPVWNLRKYNCCSYYTRDYNSYPGIHVTLFIFLKSEFQIYPMKYFMTDKQLKKRVIDGRYMDMTHYQRNTV